MGAGTPGRGAGERLPYVFVPAEELAELVALVEEISGYAAILWHMPLEPRTRAALNELGARLYTARAIITRWDQVARPPNASPPPAAPAPDADDDL